MDLRANAQIELSRSQRKELKKRTKNSQNIIGDLENNYLNKQENHYKLQDRKTRRIMRRGQKQARKQAIGGLSLGLKGSYSDGKAGNKYKISQFFTKNIKPLYLRSLLKRVKYTCE